MAEIHPTAVVDPSAELGENVRIGPFAIIEGDVRIGDGSCVHAHAIIRRLTRMGRENVVDSFSVLGGLPQDLKFDPSVESYVEIGDRNVFREGVTISRATAPGEATRIGSDTYWMAGSHAGHDARVDDHVILTNGAAVGGHAAVGPRAILAGGAMVHQFCWIGEGVMVRGKGGAAMHAPPFVMIAGIDNVVGLNRVGLRRHPDLTDQDRREVREAFDLLYRQRLTTSSALERMNACTWGPAASRFRRFVADALSAEGPFRRGVMPMRRDSRRGG